jgi:hypothetical protein
MNYSDVVRKCFRPVAGYCKREYKKWKTIAIKLKCHKRLNAKQLIAYNLILETYTDQYINNYSLLKDLAVSENYALIGEYLLYNIYRLSKNKSQKFTIHACMCYWDNLRWVPKRYFYDKRFLEILFMIMKSVYGERRYGVMLKYAPKKALTKEHLDMLLYNLSRIYIPECYRLYSIKCPDLCSPQISIDDVSPELFELISRHKPWFYRYSDNKLILNKYATHQNTVQACLRIREIPDMIPDRLLTPRLMHDIFIQDINPSVHKLYTHDKKAMDIAKYPVKCVTSEIVSYYLCSIGQTKYKKIFHKMHRDHNRYHPHRDYYGLYDLYKLPYVHHVINNVHNYDGKLLSMLWFDHEKKCNLRVKFKRI